MSDFDNATNKLVELTNRATALVVSQYAHSGPEAVMVAIHGIAGALAIAGNIVSQKGGVPSKEAMLFAAILTAEAFTPGREMGRDGEFGVASAQLELHPAIFAEAIRKFEMLGYKAEGVILDAIVQAVALLQSKSVVPFADFLAKRKEAQKGSDTIN